MFTSAKLAVIERLGINRVARATDLQAAGLASLQAEIAALRTELHAQADSQRADAAALRAQLVAFQSEIDTWRRITIGSVLAATFAACNTRVSVVMATRDRGELLRRAMQSVVDQTHRHWQLVVVDDGSTDHTADVLAEFNDDRIVRVSTKGVGAAAARNLGLTHADGEWIVFLDDDNVMAPGWLHAVAAFAARQPDAQVAFGAQLRQPESDQAQSFADSFILFTDQTDLAQLIAMNTIDLAALAVRRGAAELRFDPTLTRFIDWELVCRLAAVHHLHPLPVWTGVYTTDTAHRISHSSGGEAILAFQQRLADPDDPIGKPARH